MLIKEAVYKKVKVTQNKLVTDAIYGCDECQQEIENYPNEDQRLEMKVFHNHSEETDTLHFCSWDCALKHIPKINTDYFVGLPFIYFDSPEGSKRGSNHLVKLIRERFLNER